MNNPTKSIRRLFTLTDEAEANLRVASEVMQINHSMTIREALRVYVHELQASGRAPMTQEALRLGGVLVSVTDPPAQEGQEGAE